MRVFALVILFACLALSMTAAVFAQQAVDPTVTNYVAPQAPDGLVDLSPLTDYLINLIAAGLLAAVLWILRLFGRWLNLSEQDSARIYVQDAAKRAVDFAVKYGREYARAHSKFPVRSKLVEEAFDYLMDAVPGGLRKLNITDEQARKMILARLPDDLPTGDSDEKK
jgi:hypothetical protein